MKIVYVVMGATGGYSDRQEWPVKAFLDGDKAQELVVNAKRRGLELFNHGNYDRRDVDGKNEYDPRMCLDYTGIDYYVMDVEMDE